MTLNAAWLDATIGVRYQSQKSAVANITRRQWKTNGRRPCVITWKTHSRKIREMARLRPRLSASVASSSMGSMPPFIGRARSNSSPACGRFGAATMRSGHSRFFVVGFTILATLGPWKRAADAQQTPAIEFAFPNQLVRGQTSVIHVAVPSREVFQGAEISPAAGVTVASVTNAKKAEQSQNVAWWDVTVTVARDAAPGSRSLVLVTPAGRSTPTSLVIPDHVPTISDVRVVSATPSAVDVQFASADEKSDLGDLPYVWFTIACGGEPTVGVVKGKATGGTVRASIARPAAMPCDLELRASDAQKIDSNTLKTRIP